MFGNKRAEADRILARLERQLDLVYTALVVRDPGTSVSADAYEGLRRQVIAAASARQAHVAQLAEIDVALHRGASADDLRALVSQWLDQAGIVRVGDVSRSDAFDSAVMADEFAEVEIPAYEVAATGQLVRQGRLRAGATNPAAPAVDIPSTEPSAGDPAPPSETTASESEAE